MRGLIHETLRCICHCRQTSSHRTKAAVEFTNQPNEQVTLTFKHPLDALDFAVRWLKVLGVKALLLHAKIDGLDGIRQRHWKVLGFKGLNQGHEHI